MGLIPWEWLIFSPTLHFQIRSDVLSCRRRSFISPAFADLFDSGQMVPEFAVAHSPGRSARQFIKPFVNLRKRLAKGGQRVAAMLLKGGHTGSLSGIDRSSNQGRRDSQFEAMLQLSWE